MAEEPKESSRNLAKEESKHEQSVHVDEEVQQQLDQPVAESEHAANGDAGRRSIEKAGNEDLKSPREQQISGSRHSD